MAPAPETYAPGNTAPPSVEDWAFPGHLTVAQNNTLLEFRKALEENEATKTTLAPRDDRTLLRFLRARQFDLGKAMKMVLDDVEWRLEVGNRRMNKEMFPVVLPFLQAQFVRLGGLDLQGRPVILLRLCQAFPRKISDIMEVINFFIFYVESIQKYVESLGFCEFTAIADMKNWSLSENFSLPVVQVLAGLLQDHYPETLRYAFVVNNPFAFSAVWGLISPFLEERVKAKIHVFGKKLDKLKTYIASDVLEQEYGGTKQGVHPSPDHIAAEMIKGRVAVSAAKPYDYIQWEDEMAPGDVPKPAAAAKPATAEEGLATDFDAAVVIKTVVNKLQPAALEKKKSVRKAIARMFSTKTVEVKEQMRASAALPPAVVAAALANSNPEQRPMEVIPPKARPRIAVFGGTGRTGHAAILSLLDEHKCDVSAFVRIHGSNLSPDLVQRATTTNNASSSSGQLSIFVGEFGSSLDLERVVEDCDAVIVTIGVPPALTGGSGAEFLPLAVEKIIEAMDKFKVRRLVIVSSAHASQSWWEAGAGLFANVTKPLYWKNHYQYLAQVEDAVLANRGGLDYTIVRPGTLLEDNTLTPIKIEEGFVFSDSGPGEIGRPALCKFLLNEALDFKAESKYCNKGVAIGKA